MCWIKRNVDRESEIMNDEKVRNIWYQFWLKKERNGIIEWWYGMMIWNDEKREMELMNDEKREMEKLMSKKREMELMNDYSNWKRERNGKNEWW